MKLLLEAVKLVERRTVPVVQLGLSWGTVEWRRSTSSINGKATDGTPFTIENVTRQELALWLRGMPIQLAFPQMHPVDRSLLEHGKIRREDQELRLAPAIRPHPGETVREYITHYGLSERQLAIGAGLAPATVRDLCRCKIPITPEIAVGLEKVLRRTAHLWLNLQQRYDEGR